MPKALSRVSCLCWDEPDVYFGRAQTILREKEKIKKRRLLHQKAAAYYEPKDEPEPRLAKSLSSPENSDDGQLRTGGNGLLNVACFAMLTGE